MSKVEEVFGIYKKMLHFIGLWQDPPLTKRHSRLALLGFIFGFVMPFILTALSVFQASSVEKKIISVLYTAAYTWVFLSVILFYKNRLKVREFLNYLCTILGEDDELILFVNSACDKVLSLQKAVTIVIAFMCIFANLILPFGFDILAIPMWRLSHVNSSIDFYIYLVFHFLSFSYSCLQTPIVMLIFTVLILIIAYAKFLRFKILLLVSNKNSNGTANLIKCVKIHQNLKLLTDHFSDVLGSIIFVLYNVILFIFGCSIFALTKCEDFLEFHESLMFYFYIFIDLLFLYIPSYFGQEILTLSENYLYNLFSSEWIDSDLKYKKSVIIFMENLKQPIRMKILIFDYLNLNGFLDAVNSGYSMFTILKNVKKV